jgi:hypothetical protein
MKHKKLILAGISTALFLSLVIIGFVVLVIPSMEKKILSELTKERPRVKTEIGRVSLSLFPLTVLIEDVKVLVNSISNTEILAFGEIKTVRIGGISIMRYVFSKSVTIREIELSGGYITAIKPPEKNRDSVLTSPLNVEIEKLMLNDVNVSVSDYFSSQRIEIEKGAVTIHNVTVKKNDTLSLTMCSRFDFSAQKLVLVSADSLVTTTISAVEYSEKAHLLTISQLSIVPNFSNYRFTARHKYQTVRTEIHFSDITLHNFLAAAFIDSKSLICSFVELGNMQLHAFSDRRKPKKHRIKPAFQELMYHYPGYLRVDSVSLKQGNIKYTEHAEKAKEAGYIEFKEVHARLYNISNDTIHKTNPGYLRINCNALVMGKGLITVSLKSRLFDPYNTFSLDGTLSGMEISALNPILENNAFISAQTGTLNAMEFNFVATDEKAVGTLTMLYDNLKIAVLNRQTNNGKAFRERLISFVANSLFLTSNPIQGKSIRVGTIDYNRDPEKFVINYSFKAVLSGMISSISNLHLEDFLKRMHNREKKRVGK